MFLKSFSDLCALYTISPLHAGSGQALGAVDLPIQRERHTGWPQVQASGVKGAFRDWFYRYYNSLAASLNNPSSQDRRLTERIFGAEEGGEGADGQAGAVTLTDARLLAFPVRSNVAPFVWVTCPTALERLRRDLTLCNADLESPVLAPAGESTYLSITRVTEPSVVLEDLAVKREEVEEVNLGSLKQLQEMFEKLAPQVTRLLLLSDADFTFLVQTATEIQPQIKIDIETGTAKDGSLRYEELLPSDSLLYCLVFFSPERIKGDGLLPQVVEARVKEAISSHIQMGGDMTLGRGLMEVNWLRGIK
jgi:CRISPR-associated protein Cmr4